MQKAKEVIPSYRSFALRGYEIREEALWACQTCGLVEPSRMRHNGRWMRNQCPCQVEQQRREQIVAQQEVMVENLITASYDWLGRAWSDRALLEKTFETFDAARQQEAYETARFFAENPGGTLVLHGPFGTGKTHLLAAICNDLRLRFRESRFTTAPKLFKVIGERIGRNEEYDELLKKATQTPLLVLDDVDKAKWSEFREEIYFTLIDERVKRDLPTAISTNRLDDLASYVGGAVASRLGVRQIAVEMSGADYRTQL